MKEELQEIMDKIRAAEARRNQLIEEVFGNATDLVLISYIAYQ